MHKIFTLLSFPFSMATIDLEQSRVNGAALYSLTVASWPTASDPSHEIQGDPKIMKPMR
jgi:hypothetical protein